LTISDTQARMTGDLQNFQRRCRMSKVLKAANYSAICRFLQVK